MPTTQSIFATLTLLTLTAACAEPGTLDTKAAAKGGSTSTNSGGGTNTATDSGGSTSTTTSSNGGSTTTSSNGGSTGTTTTPKGGTTGTTTSTSSGGTTTTTTSTTPSNCGTTTEEIVVTNTPRQNETGAMTLITPAADKSIPVAELGVKFCFTVISTGAVTVSPSAMKIYSGGIENLTAAPYYVGFSSTTKVTVETGADGANCLVVDVASSAAGAELTGKADIKLDWILDTSGLGAGAMLDPMKPAQIIVTRGTAVAGCGDVKI